MLKTSAGVVAAVLAAFSLSTIPWAGAQSVYEQDVRFALPELEKECRHFFDLKKIDWAAVSRQFLEESKSVKTDQDHLLLLLRLTARLRDGHATVLPREKTRNLTVPEPGGRPAGPGMFWCTIGEGIYVKNAFGAAQAAGVRGGMEVLQVNGLPVRQWLAKRMEERADRIGASTPQQSLYSTLHWGLAHPAGTELLIEVKDVDGAAMGFNVTCQRATYIPWGPLSFAPGLRGNNDVKYGRLASGFGYIHLRRCPQNLPEQMDEALGAIGDAPGLVLDFRANGGGGFDHEAFIGRFVPAGRRLEFGRVHESAGPKPYGGPIVVIVDGNTRSAGETGSGMFKEDGRAYMIGESPTAGSSSQKKTLELPSGLFALYFSVGSNMKRFNEGRGIEGIGVIPHEIVQYRPRDLAGGVDTLLKRAEEILRNYPQEKVKYDPTEFGWREAR